MQKEEGRTWNKGKTDVGVIGICTQVHLPLIEDVLVSFRTSHNELVPKPTTRGVKRWKVEEMADNFSLSLD